MVLPRLNVVSWYSKDDFTGHGKRKREENADRRKDGKSILKIGMDFDSSTRAAENRTSMKWIVAKASMLPDNRIEELRYGRFRWMTP